MGLGREWGQLSTVLSEPTSLQRGRLILGRSAVGKSVCKSEEGVQGRGQCAASRQGQVWGVWGREEEAGWRNRQREKPLDVLKA